jgi:hypothetical protein
MTTALPETLLRFIQACIPTFQSAQVLLFLMNHSDRDFAPEEIVTAMRPTVVRLSSVKEYTALFARHHILSEYAGRFRYSAPADVEDSIHELARAYNEQPVTLIRAVSNSSV